MSTKGKPSLKKDRTYEELYGSEKAEELKRKLRKSHLDRIYSLDGVALRKDRWLREELAILKSEWGNGQKVCDPSRWKKLLPNRTYASIRTKAKRLKLKSEFTGLKTFKCEICGGIFNGYGGRKVCGVSCQAVLCSKNRVGEGNPFYNQHHTRETLQKILNSFKPSGPELYLDSILQNHFPDEWQFVGGGEVTFGRLCPDFINCNGKKQIIELFGDYWHDRKNMKYHQTEQGRKEAFAHFGYSTLIIWESELSNEERVIEKIRCFNEPTN